MKTEHGDTALHLALHNLRSPTFIEALIDIGKYITFITRSPLYITQNLFDKSAILKMTKQILFEIVDINIFYCFTTSYIL